MCGRDSVVNLPVSAGGAGAWWNSGDRDVGEQDLGALILLGRASDGGWHFLHSSKYQWVCPNPVLSHGFANAGSCIPLQCSPTASLKLAGRPRSYTTPQDHENKWKYLIPWSPLPPLKLVGVCTVHTWDASWVFNYSGKGGLHFWAPQSWNNWSDSFWQGYNPKVQHRQKAKTPGGRLGSSVG